jgi:hypothetical protein
MAKTLRPLFLLIAFLASTVVTLATVQPTPAQANAAAPALYKIVPMETTTTPVGCIGCSPMTTSIPAFEAQSRMGQALAAATEIDTFTTSIYNPTTQQSESTDGGCAIVSGGLKCWGSNTYGQLGNGLTTDSPNATVTAADNGAPLSGVTDVSTNGLTTCVVADGALKCAGLGNWPGLSMKRTYSSQTITDYANSSSSSSSSSQYKLEVFNSQDQLLSTVQNTNGLNESPFSTQWVALPGFGANVAKVQVGSNSNNTATPTICVLTTTGEASCAVVEAGTRTTSSSSSTEYKCPPSDSWSTTVCQSWETYSSKSIWTEVTVMGTATWSWASAGATNVKDISLPADSWAASTLCLAGDKTICRTFASGEFGDIKTIENADNSEMVYVSSGFGGGLGLCVYASGTVSCGGGTYTNTGQPAMATKVTPVAAMTRPRSIFVSFGASMLHRIFFVLESGILSADSWIFSCNGCNNQQGSYVSPVTAFKVSTATEFNFAESVTGATDNVDYIPLRVLSGSRKSRSSVQVTVRTNAGASLVGTSIRWTAPDAPGTLSSSTTSTLTSGEGGLARTTLVSGPITFTLSGGSLASGATLQAASITTLVPESGAIVIEVLDAPAIVSRTISVTLPDGSAVPSATVNLVNNYLTYAYLNSGSSTSTWSSRPRDTTGNFGQVTCAHCFVAPPRYATGSNGSVTFPSFNLGIRSTTHDADVSYDDGELNQNVKKSFSSISDTVQMPFMAKIAATINDADPSTPAVELNTDSSGGVDIETSLVDEDNIPISEFESTAEVVCDAMETGGLISASAKVDNLCLTTTPYTGPPPGPVTSRGVSSMSVSAATSCNTTLRVKTNASGKSTFKLCPSVSTRYRIRGKGALATRSFCVVVNGRNCSGASSALTPVTAPVAAPASVKKLAKVKTGKSISFAAVNKVAKVAVPKGAKVAISVVGSSKSVCSVKGTSIKALKPGTCRLKVSVTPKATAKVKKPKTKSTSVSVTVTGTPTVGVKKTITLAAALKLFGSPLANESDVSAEVSKTSKKICSVSGNRIRGLKKGSCVLLVSVVGQTVKLPIIVK